MTVLVDSCMKRANVVARQKPDLFFVFSQEILLVFLCNSIHKNETLLRENNFICVFILLLLKAYIYNKN